MNLKIHNGQRITEQISAKSLLLRKSRAFKCWRKNQLVSHLCEKTMLPHYRLLAKGYFNNWKTIAKKGEILALKKNVASKQLLQHVFAQWRQQARVSDDEKLKTLRVLNSAKQAYFQRWKAALTLLQFRQGQATRKCQLSYQALK